MNSKKQTLLWIWLIITLALGITWQFYPLTTAQGRLNKIPIMGPNFEGQDIPLSRSEEKFFKQISLVKRIYKLDGRYYFITVLDGSNNRHIVHDPYYCFRGAGWEIDGERDFQLPGGNSKIINIHKGEERREALFLFSDGEKTYTSPMRYWWETTLRRLTLGSSGPEPILMMIQPITSEKVDWKRVTEGFNPIIGN